MPHPLFSPEWIDAWAAGIRASDEYRQAARKWKWPIVFTVDAEPAAGIPDARYVWLDLLNGECREARPGSAQDVPRADFVLGADLATWKEVLAGRLDPVTGIARRRLRLEKGSVATLALHASSARALVRTAARVSVDAPSPAVDAVAMPQPKVSPQPKPAARHETFITTRAGGLRNDIPPMRLWRKAKRLGIWNPEDIDFSRDRDDWNGLDAEQQDVLLRLTALFVAGEESVTLDLLPLMLAIAGEGRLEEEMFLTTFLWEEAKHVDFFYNGFLRNVAPEAGDLSRYHGPAYLRIFGEELPGAMNRLLEDRSTVAQVRASVTYNMIVEGVLAETGYDAYYAALERNDLLPGLRRGIGYLKQDESRHIAYGVFLLSRLIAEDRSLWPVVETRMNELLPLALQMIDEIFAAYDVVPFGLRQEEFVEIALTNFGRRMNRIERAREQTLEEVYETAAANEADSERDESVVS